MFRENQKHLQPPLLSAVAGLGEKQQERLAKSWAGVFYREFFCRIPEDMFAVLYVDKPSRPNVAVNVLFGLEALKSAFGWSDEELYDHFLYDLQVRYALGIHDLATEQFDVRTLYNFRHRLSNYTLEHGVNLVAESFAKLTDAQVAAYKLNTRIQRMDSTHIASNIYNASRLHLLVEGLQRLASWLTPEQLTAYGERLAPYIGLSAEQVVDRYPGRIADDAELQQIGELLADLLVLLEGAPQAALSDKAQAQYAVVVRLFNENYKRVASPADLPATQQVQTKSNEELMSGCLQSLHDTEATFQRKNNKAYKGYVANLTQTCDPESKLQLITHVQVAPNNVHDSTLLREALPELKRRTALTTLYTDGGYASEQVDSVLEEQQVTQIPTGIKGPTPAPATLSLADFTIVENIVENDDAIPLQMTCPAQQTVPVLQARGDHFVAHFDVALCSSCPLATRCRVRIAKRKPQATLYFTKGDMHIALRRQRMRQVQKSGKNPRAAIEAAIRSVKHPFRQGKAPVRGRFRTTMVLVLSAAMSNLRALYRHLSQDPVPAPAT